MRSRNCISLLSLILLSVFPTLTFAQTTPVCITVNGQEVCDDVPPPQGPPPTTTTTQGFSQQGIFDCNKSGAYSGVGSTVAIGGPTVPVADYAVELNTGLLVYKECVLRNIVIRQREAAMAAFLKKIETAIQTGRGGNPQYVVNQNQELLTNVSDPTAAAFLQSGVLDAVHPSFRSDVQRAVAMNYQVDTRAPEMALNCPFEGDISVYQKDPTHNFSWDAFYASAKPACNPFWAKLLAIDLLNGRVAAAVSAQRDEWNWGRGVYAVTDNAADPLQRRVLTPASVVQGSFQNVLDSSVRRLENADDIGGMTDALFAGLETHIVADSRGLAGISQGIGGALSYLDQLVANSTQSLRNAAVNAALQILTSARQIESSYLQAATSIGTTLVQAGGQLKSAENQCWGLIIAKICTTPLNAKNECNGVVTTSIDVGTTTVQTVITTAYKVSTSTAGYAQSIIATQIAPLVTVAATNTAASKAALARIDTLIQGVSKDSTPANQKTALLELDALVAQRQIHTPPDVDGPNGILKRLSSVQSAMSTLVSDTVESWTDNGNPNIGWCNGNNPAVIQKWKDAWKKS